MTGTKTRLATKRKSLTDIQGKQAKKQNSSDPKSSVKSELEMSLQTLQDKYDELLNENKRNLEKNWCS